MSTSRAAPSLLMTTSVPSTLTAFLLPYAEHYRRRGWRVEAASNGVTGVARCVEAFDAVHDIGWTRSPSDPVNLTQAPARLRQIVREGGFDIVHAHDPIAAFVTRFALRGMRAAGVRVVYTAHGFHFYEGAPPVQATVFREVERLASRWTDRLIVINHEDLASAGAFPVARRGGLRYMPGIGVDMRRYDPAAVDDGAVAAVRDELSLAPGQPLFLMIAEFNPGKRHRDAVAALANAASDDAVLAFAGVGPLMDEVAAQARSLGVQDRVRFLGYRDDIPVLLRASTAMLLPSEREGLPRSIMEAAALERPVVATRIRGVTELVTPETGFLVEVGDVPALSRALDRLASDPEGARAMGAAGRRAMAAFDLARVLELHDELYAELLGEPSGAGGVRDVRGVTLA